MILFCERYSGLGMGTAMLNVSLMLHLGVGLIWLDALRFQYDIHYVEPRRLKYLDIMQCGRLA